MPEIKTEQKQIKEGTKMRNAFIRISSVNMTNFDDDKRGIKAGDVVTYGKEDILQILDDWTKTRDIKYYMIEHNHDKENVHYHVVIDFPKDSEATFQTIKNKFPYGNIDRCRYGVKSCVQYLVHMNEEAKEKYEWDEVETNAPDKLEDYKLPGKQNKDAKLQKLLDSIIYGSLRKYEIDKIEPDMYIKYGRKIDRAFEYREKVLLSNPSRKIAVYVLQGGTGLGKSTFCRKWAEDNQQSIYFSSASNDPWQDYNGQDIFVYDDFRPYKMPIEDLMKSIDPYVNSTTAGRYRNKLFIGDTIFLTTNIPILDWFRGSDERVREAFFRRISKVLEFTKDPNEYGVSLIQIQRFNESYNALTVEGVKRFDVLKYNQPVQNEADLDFESKLEKVLHF